MIRKQLIELFQGIAVGAANVIPGLSGGTIALITGIYERLIHSIRSFNLHALQLLAKANIKEFLRYTDFWFLFRILLGVAIAIVSAARVLGYLFATHPTAVWAFFFGLVLASVIYIGKTIRTGILSVWVAGVAGLMIAVGITFMTPATESEGFVYLMLCGAVSMCSMILPGLSGSYVLIIMGNYQLVFIEAVNAWRFEILIPFALGAAAGLLAFSHLLSWVFKTYRAQTLALLTGFIAGSLGVLWPWKTEITETFGFHEKVIGYTWHLPEFNLSLLFSLLIMAAGFMVVLWMEYAAPPKPGKE